MAPVSIAPGLEVFSLKLSRIHKSSFRIALIVLFPRFIFQKECALGVAPRPVTDMLPAHKTRSQLHHAGDLKTLINHETFICYKERWLRHKFGSLRGLCHCDLSVG
jgi:hypothetical protein